MQVPGCVRSLLQRPGCRKRAMCGGPTEEALGRGTKAKQEARRHALHQVGIAKASARAVRALEGVDGRIGRIARNTLWVVGQPAARAGQHIGVAEVAESRLGRHGTGQEVAGNPGGFGKVGVEAGVGQWSEPRGQGSCPVRSGRAAWAINGLNNTTYQRLGIASATSTLVAQSLGAGDPVRARLYARTGLRMALALAL
mgnify:CR=1 FL=1